MNSCPVSGQPIKLRSQTRMKTKRRTAMDIVNKLKKMIVLEGLDRLPGELELSERLSVSRAVVREALRVLEYEGITRTIHGSGTFVLKRTKLRIQFNVNFEIETDSAKDIFDLIEVRSTLEKSAIALAISNACESDIEEFSQCMEKLSKAIETRVELSSTDAGFHKKIFEISHNRFLKEVFDVVFDGLEVLWKSPLGLETFGDAGLPLHKELFEAIKSRNLERAFTVYDRIIELDRKDIYDLTGYGRKLLHKCQDNDGRQAHGD